MKTIRKNIITLLLAGTACAFRAEASPIDVQREDIIRYTRLGETELREGTKQLEDLYRQTADQKVRDDLITLMVRQNRNKDALALCARCRLTGYSENELEHLAKAARNERQFETASLFYAQLAKSAVKNPNGLLGLALVHVEMSRFDAAKQYLTQYKKRFGANKQYEEANTYLLDNSESLTARLNRWQQDLERQPQNTDSAKKLYRLSALLNISPTQDKLIAAYPDVFTENDKLWLSHDNAIRLSKGSPTREQLERVLDTLKRIDDKTGQDSPLKTQVLQDMVVISSRIGINPEIKEYYARLNASGSAIPNYVKEAYADYLLASGSPFSALNTYRQVENDHLEKKQKVPFALQMKLVNAMSDAARFDQAQEYMEQKIPEPTMHVMDFTQAKKVLNPAFDSYFLGKVNLLSWRGDINGAIALIDERLAKTPGDVWMMTRKAELEHLRGRSDDAQFWLNKAEAFLDGSRWVSVTRTNVALDINDWKTASEMINSLSPEEKRAARYVTEQYAQLKAARFVASGGISHRTSPSGQPNESKQEYYLYSPKTEGGDDVYIHYMATESPDERRHFEQQRIGAGMNVNFYPLQLTVEAGKTAKPKNKGYFSTNIQYRLNQHWHFSVYGNINGSNTPIKAVYQDIYTKDIGTALTYIYSNRFKLGTNVNMMKFDDENRRKDISAWSYINLFKYDRWSLDNNLFWSHQRNKRILRAHYYNPARSESLEGNLDLTYLQPFNYRIILTHHLKGGLGHYWQSRFPSNQMWSVAYGHDWRFGKQFGISYEVGRKKNIYDGRPEYNNFINAGMAVYFW